MQVAPLPMRPVRTQSPLQFGGSLFQRLRQQRVGLRNGFQASQNRTWVGAGNRKNFRRQFGAEPARPNLKYAGELRIGSKVTIPVQKFVFESRLLSAFRRPRLEELYELLCNQGDAIVLELFEIENVEFGLLAEELGNPFVAFRRSPVIGELVRIALRQDVVV